MWKAFRGMLTFTLPNLAGMAAFAAVSTLGAYLTGVPHGAENLFRTYFSAFPLMSMLFLFMFGFSLCTANLNVLLSFGCTRRDYFGGLQLTMALYVLAGAAISFVMSMLPVWQHWADTDKFLRIMGLGGITGWVYLLTGAAVLLLGALSGLIFSKSKVWGTVLLTVGILASMAALVLLMLSSDLDAALYSADGMTPDLILSRRLWGDLPVILGGVFAAVIAVSEFCLNRFIKRYSVR